MSGNTVFDNTVAGIAASGSLVTGNTVYGQLSPNAVGIQAYSSEIADNVVYTNVTGISGQDSSIHNNRLYNNSNAAIFVQFSGPSLRQPGLLQCGGRSRPGSTTAARSTAT